MNDLERRHEDSNNDTCSFIIKKQNCTSIPIHWFSIQSKVIMFLLIEIIGCLDQLKKNMHDLSQNWISLSEKTHEVSDSNRYHAKTKSCGRRERPPYDIDIE